MNQIETIKYEDYNNVFIWHLKQVYSTRLNNGIRVLKVKYKTATSENSIIALEPHQTHDASFVFLFYYILCSKNNPSCLTIQIHTL